MNETANGNGTDPYSAFRSDPLVANRMLAHVANMLFSRAELARSLNGDQRRNIDDECGYPRDISPELYQDYYDRDPIAARVVECLPKESWQVQPSVYESEDAETITAFEQAWDNVSRQLRGETSYYQDEEGSAVWAYLQRADEQSGIGRYAVILIGINDKRPLSEPAVGIVEEGTSKTPTFGPYSLNVNADAIAGRRLLYLRVMPESQATIVETELNMGSPRYNQPTMYSVTLSNGTGARTERVHWTRVLHVCEGEVFHTPRMQRPFNRLQDLKKIYGADAEGFWRNGVLKIFMKAIPDSNGVAPIIDRESLRDDFEKMMNGLQQWMGLEGVEPTSISPAVSDPTSHVNAHIEAICIQLGIPKRVFMGSERGELASSQDDAAWNDRLKARQKFYITPKVIAPFVDRLILLGVLPKPAGFSVWWPDLTSQTQTERATNVAQRTAAMAQYVGGGVDGLMAPVDYLARELGYSDEEAQAIVDGAAANQEEDGGAMLDAPEQPSPPAANVANCGGPGSGVPGPCPKALDDLEKSLPSMTKRSEAAKAARSAEKAVKATAKEAATKAAAEAMPEATAGLSPKVAAVVQKEIEGQVKTYAEAVHFSALGLGDDVVDKLSAGGGREDVEDSIAEFRTRITQSAAGDFAFAFGEKAEGYLSDRLVRGGLHPREAKEIASRAYAAVRARMSTNLAANCGGEGGTPGPCPKGGGESKGEGDKGKAPAAPKAEKAAKLKSTYERAGSDPSLSYEEIDEVVSSMASLSVKDLQEVAVEVRVRTGKTKPELLRAIGAAIKTRKASTERTGLRANAEKREDGREYWAPLVEAVVNEAQE